MKSQPEVFRIGLILKYTLYKKSLQIIVMVFTPDNKEDYTP